MVRDCYDNFIYLDFIEKLLKKPILEFGVLSVGNSLNRYFTFDSVEDYANEIKKGGIDRVSKSSKDAITGRIVEEVVTYYKFW